MAVGVNVAVGMYVTVGEDVLVPVAVTEVGIVPRGLVSVLVVVGTNDGKDEGAPDIGIGIVFVVVVGSEEGELVAPIAVVGIMFGRTILLLLLGDSVLFLGETITGTAVVSDPDSDPVAAAVVPSPLLLPSLAVLLLFCFQQSGLVQLVFHGLDGPVTSSVPAFSSSSSSNSSGATRRRR